MLPIFVLHKDEKGVLYELPAGKPDPTLPCPVGKEDRPRVRQSAAKGRTCWYYAMNFLRTRVGCDPMGDHSVERKIEKTLSEHRKKLSDIDITFPTKNMRTSGVFKQRLPDDRAAVHSLIGLYELGRVECVHASVQALFDVYIDLCKRFIAQQKYNSMATFLQCEETKLKDSITRDCLIGLGVDPRVRFAKVISEVTGMNAAGLTLEKLCAFSGGFDNVLRSVAAEKYGLKTSDWTPDMSIEVLIQEMKLHGPLYVSGALGACVYVAPPRVLRSVAGRTIHFWPKGSARNNLTAGHAVVLVGAEKTSGGPLIYYVDPNDPSDPKDKSLQKIYAISYKNLVDSVVNLMGGASCSREKSRYSYYGDFDVST